MTSIQTLSTQYQARLGGRTIWKMMNAPTGDKFIPADTELSLAPRYQLTVRG